MDLDNFLAFQRSKLQADIDGLALQDRTCTGKLESAKNCNEILGNGKTCDKNATMDFPPRVADPTVAAAGESQSLVVTAGACTKSSMATSPMHRQHNVQDVNTENNVFQIRDNLGRNYRELSDETAGNSKAAKNWVNLTERQSADASANDRKLHKTKDEMEQWVSDTFYSYFPGYNNENKKRQDILRDRQLEYQQNFLKHQMIEAATNNGKKKHPHRYSNENAENTENATKTPHTSRSDKTELEIIVNNPDYEAKSPRPGSARHKLLQDLKHTEISNIVNSDGVTDRNRRNAETEIAKKKDYQKELMAQIEEKRRSIEALKEKERRQEEALTRKLQEQLRTIRLEEELEKEKMRADKVRFDSEQNRLMREHLLTKLENDAKLLLSARKTRSENDKVVPAEKNKVYKYFSNSARNEYKRGAEVEPPAFHLDLPPSSGRYKECFHNSENTCPFCVSPLKNYENWCLQCERRLPEPLSQVDSGNLICENCKKKYSFCGSCEKSNENCKHSQRKRGTCANCRISLCSDCIESIAASKCRKKSESERSFQILEVNYPEDSDDDANNNAEQSRPPYSMNIDRNSIFHHSFNRSKLFDDENNIESIRQETDKRLSRYLKNYGDLASKALRDRSTQTTPDSASRRDVVMVEENNLSMPLLREMPRMTRKESNLQQAERKKKGTRIENLSRRWEVPAVQKHTITTNSPKVLTQLGAIRKQLQSEQLQLNY